MATGGEEFGDDTTPILRKTDNQDDEDAGPGGDQTTEFEPGASSTPAPNGTRQTTMNRTGEELSFPDTPGLSTTTAAKNELLKYFKNFDQDRIKYALDEKNGRLKVGIARTDKPFYYLLTKIPGKDEYQINKNLPKEVLKALGKGEIEILKEEMESLAEGMKHNKEVAENPNESKTEKNKARERWGRQMAEFTDKKRQLDKLIKGNFSPLSESIELETFQKNDGVRQEKEQELKHEKKEQQDISMIKIVPPHKKKDPMKE